MKFTREASASWQGSGKEGKGRINTGSGVLDEAKYAFGTRFENGVGTNPEELIGAAHAGCYTMQLSFLLNENNYTAEHLHTDAKVTFRDGEITTIDLSLKGKVPGISEKEFEAISNKAKEVCPVSKLLKADITLQVTLED
ncbi:OsmC family protein [Lacinutrix neustonica]|uniref:OsmC family protein n=1 Tax=Lacinutrix neustonica TaxID=2980107 RepID=A0A9E8MXL6_9FLAO|nr:OsmC family protein [Lacinutrix neustonica]WAC02412.1 OsmC family protein [Lacinutrix neustonica]